MDQKRSVFLKSSCTSGFFQLRSGCSTVKMCRYHWPSATRCQAGPRTATASRSVAVRRVRRALRGRCSGRVPASRVPRSVPPGTIRACSRCGSARCRRRSSCHARGAPSRVRRNPQACPDVGPRCGSRSHHSRHLQARKGRTGEPDGIHAKVLEIRHLFGDAGDVSESVAVGVAEATRVHLIDNGLFPSRRACCSRSWKLFSCFWKQIQEPL